MVYNSYPGGNAATIAQCPNGLLYYAINAGVNQLYVFNPQTPTVAPGHCGVGPARWRTENGVLALAGVLYYMTESATQQPTHHQHHHRCLYRRRRHGDR